MADGMEQMRRDHAEGNLTAELLLRSPYAPDEGKITAEILALCKMIDAERDGPRKAHMIGAFQALMWARSPAGYSPVSETSF